MNKGTVPRLYAAHVAQFKEDLPFWRYLAGASGGPILELGCGPGRVLLDLAREGWTVTGLDMDEAMLQWARSQIPEGLHKRITLIQGDIRSFHLPDQYPLVIIPCNTFAYFNDVDAIQLLQCVKQHLTKKGQLAMAIPNPHPHISRGEHLQKNPIPESEPIHDFIEPIREHPVQVYAYEEYDQEENILHVLWAYDELFPDGRVRRIQLPVSYHLRSLEETRELLLSVGLTVKEVYGDFQRGPLRRDSEEMIVVAA